MITKIVSFILGVMFLLFSAVQYNDPDPLWWMAIYGSVMFVCFFRVWNKSNRTVILILMVLIGAYSIGHVPGVIEWLKVPDKSEIFGEMYITKPYIEESREFFGMMIAILSLFYQLKVAKRKS